MMKRGWAIAGGIGLGALLMYVLDPAEGRRRRARRRDKLVRAVHLATEAVRAAARDTRNRLFGLAAELRAALTEDEVPDEILAARVRARLGRLVEHPRSVEVTACQGHVMLRGTVYEHEAGELLRAVAQVRGVEHVRNRLTERRSRADEQPSGRPWTPAEAAAAAVGTALVGYGVRRRDLPGAALGLLGLGLAGQRLLHADVGRFVGRNVSTLLGDVDEDASGGRGVSQPARRADAPTAREAPSPSRAGHASA